MSEVQAPVTTEREVTIYATRGGNMKKIMTNAQTWGDLQPLVRREGFDLSSLLAAENINKSDLVNDLAVLPATAFRLFLRPKQTKSGAYDRKECFEIIKIHLLNHPEDKEKFRIDGRNVTQLPTATVQDLVAKYCKGAKAPAASNTATEAPKAEKVTEAPQSNATPLADAERVAEALRLVAPLSGYDSYAKVEKHLNRLSDEVSIANTPACTDREETEEEAIAREAREMSAGYR